MTCETADAPAAIATTTNANCGWLNPPVRDATNPAAVTIATVADPCATRTNTANTYANKSTGIPVPSNDCFSASLTPLSPRNFLNTPPAPVIRMMIPAGPNERVVTSISTARSTFRKYPKNTNAPNVAINNATIGCPKNNSAFTQNPASPRAANNAASYSALLNPVAIPDARNSFATVPNTINRIGTPINPMINPKCGSFPSSITASGSSSGGAIYIRFAIHAGAAIPATNAVGIPTTHPNKITHPNPTPNS